MITIRCTTYQKGEFERYLRYAIDKKHEDVKNDKITEYEAEYDIDKINTLLKVVNGKVYEDYFDVAPRAHREKQEKVRWREED